MDSYSHESVLVGRYLIAALHQTTPKSQKYQNIKQFVSAFEDDVFAPIGATFKLEEYEYVNGKCTALKDLHFGKHHDRILWYLHEEGTVYTYNSRKVTPQSEQEIAKERELLGGITYQLPPEVNKIKDYLNKLPSNYFSSQVNENFDAAVKFYLAYENVSTLPKYHILNRIKERPKPCYRETRKKKTTRLFAGNSLISVKSEVRKILLPDLLEFDLTCAQLAIGSVVIGYPKIKKYLRKPNSNLWDNIIRKYKKSKYAKEIKNCIKKAVYSLQYGMSFHGMFNNLKSSLTEVNKDLEPIAYDITTNHWVFKEMKERLEIYTENLLKKGTVQDAFGRIFFVTEETIASDMAVVAQSYETKLLLPIFEYFIEHKKTNKKEQARIALFQFDGFSLYVRDKERSQFWINQINQLIKEGVKNCVVSKSTIPTSLALKE